MVSKQSTERGDSPKYENNRRWAVCVNDEVTFEAMFRYYCSLGLTGPLHSVFGFRHYVYKDNPKTRYSVPRAVVEYLSQNRKSCGFDFYGFSKNPSDTWALYNEGRNMHIGMRQRLFDGSAFRGNERLLTGKLTKIKEI